MRSKDGPRGERAGADGRFERQQAQNLQPQRVRQLRDAPSRPGCAARVPGSSLLESGEKGSEGKTERREKIEEMRGKGRRRDRRDKAAARRLCVRRFLFADHVNTGPRLGRYK